MAVLTWGEPVLEICELDDKGAIPSSPTWKELPEIVQGTAQLSTEDGEVTEALDEGGAIVDSRTKKSKYSFACELFVKKGDTKPIEDEDGVVTKNYAIRLTPEDSTLKGWILPKTSVSVKTTWSSTDGTRWAYTFKGLKPATGTILQEYTKGS